MERNTNPLVSPVETPNQIVQHPVNNQRGNSPIILGVILLLIVGSGAYFLGLNQNSFIHNAPEVAKEISLKTIIKEPATGNEIIAQGYKTIYPKDFYIVSKDRWDVSIQKKGVDTPYPIIGIKYIDSALTQEMNLSDWLPRISTGKQEVKNDAQCKSEINKLKMEIDNKTKGATYGGPFGNAYKNSNGECWYYVAQNVKSSKKTFAPYGELEVLEFDSEYEPLNNVKRKDILLKNGMHIIDFYLIGTDRLQANGAEYGVFRNLLDNFQFTN